jgi:hypothetical protein
VDRPEKIFKTMILKKIVVPTAKWNHEDNKWNVHEATEWCWTDMKHREISPWFNKLENALDWSIIADQKKNLEFRSPEEGLEK